ncbi:MAG: transporter substrate-binding domain-containing protein, partial [Firmicutes bacterium]|nr:transporter substrate-binding domain-containing protein [Bacillota bacterium]
YGFSTQPGEIAVMSESLKSGAMQAIITEQCVAESYIAANAGKFQMIADNLTEEEIKAITNMNNDKLQAKVNEIIKAFVNSDAYSELIVKWFD